MDLITEEQLHPRVIAKLNHTEPVVFNGDLTVNGDIVFQNDTPRLVVKGLGILVFDSSSQGVAVNWLFDAKQGATLENGTKVNLRERHTSMIT
jgi:hypothetical protein